MSLRLAALSALAGAANAQIDANTAQCQASLLCVVSRCLRRDAKLCTCRPSAILSGHSLSPAPLLPALTLHRVRVLSAGLSRID